MDAVTIALMRPSIAKTLSERISLREAQWNLRKETGWKTHKGDFASRTIYDQWLEHMEALTELFNIELAEDRIPVMRNSRLRLGNGRAHEDTISPFIYKQVGDSWSISSIDRASTPALWCALTRAEDFDPKKGLPASPSRVIRLHDKHLVASEKVGIFGSGSAALAVRDGWAKLGDAVHHARIYRIEGKRPSYVFVRVYQADLLKYRDQDLFSAPLPPQSISMRTASNTLKNAIASHTATYVGWLITGDELKINFRDKGFESGVIGDFLSDFPGIQSWQVDGFPDANRIRVRPSLLSAEGFKIESESTFQKGTFEILQNKGWRVSLNTILAGAEVTVIRRNSLGIIRHSSHSSLPTTYSLSL